MEPKSIDQVFWEAAQLASAEERAAYLDAACADDPRLREQVEQLLRARWAAGSFLETPAVSRPAEGSGGDTRTGPAAPASDESLEFLTPSDKPGSIGQLGHYEVQAVAGRGGMGVVLKAFDENLHRVVAVKVMAPQLAVSAAARQRFTREARAAAAVTHDHIVTIHAVEQTGGQPYIVMQYVDGLSLQDRLDRSGILPLREVLRIGMQTASGLAAAHKQGLVHRDVKPANILLENGVERVKITDFGLARAVDEGNLTQSGVVAGTPQYMSPEQAEGKPVDARSDLFSLGSVLYAMCAGVPPFRGSTARAVLRRVCEDTTPSLRQANPELPEWLVAIIDRLHAKDPAARFQNAEEVEELLGRHLAHLQHPSQISEPVPVPRRVMPASPARARYRWVLAAAALLLLTAGLGLSEAVGVTNVRATVSRMFTPDGPGGGRPGLALTPVAESGAFVVLGGRGVAEKKFDTLAEAVRNSDDGDTVEVRGNGPFVTDPVTITDRRALAIRAGNGARPVIRLNSGTVERHHYLISTNGQLRLEGLEVQTEQISKSPGEFYVAVHATGGVLHVANCRFFTPWRPPLSVWGSRRAVVKNCEFLGPWNSGLEGRHVTGGVWEMANCVLVGGAATGCGIDSPDMRDAVVRIRRCSMVHCQLANIYLNATPREPETGRKTTLFELEASDSLTKTGALLYVTRTPSFLERSNPLHAATGETVIHRLVGWRGSDNVHHRAGKAAPDPADALILCGTLMGAEPVSGVHDLTSWRKFWDSPETGSIQGEIHFQGGDLAGQVAGGADKLTPDDFRLRPDSAGYRAGKDGKDLGADVDLVGPGPAYERWKKTPDYQQWLQETEQKK